MSVKPPRRSPAMSDVDPKEAIEAKCKESSACLPLLEALEACAERVNGKPGTAETCTQELFELRSCLDACVLFLMIIVMILNEPFVDYQAVIFEIEIKSKNKDKINFSFCNCPW